MGFQMSLTSILLLANALLLGVATLVIIRFRRESQAILKFWYSPLGSALVGDRGDASANDDANDKRLLGQSLMRLEQQMLLLRRDVLRNATRSEAAAEAPGIANEARRGLPLDNAVRMARMGATADDLARNCGLSPGEARLMQKLHGKTPTKH